MVNSGSFQNTVDPLFAPILCSHRQVSPFRALSWRLIPCSFLSEISITDQEFSAIPIVVNLSTVYTTRRNSPFKRDSSSIVAEIYFTNRYSTPSAKICSNFLQLPTARKNTNKELSYRYPKNVKLALRAYRGCTLFDNGKRTSVKFSLYDKCNISFQIGTFFPEKYYSRTDRTMR